MAIAILVSLMTFGAPAFAGLDPGDTPVKLVVKYDTNGGSTIEPEFVSSGGTVLFRHTPVKECYSFEGWYYDSALTQVYNWSDPIVRDLTLYAKWTVPKSNAPCSMAALTSTIGTVSTGGTANETITVESGIGLAALKAAITPTPNATFEIYKADGITKATTLETGMKIIVTPQSGTKVTYTITVGSPNLALNRPATGDSSCNASQSAAKAVDGSVTDSKWCSPSGSHWLQIDLGSVKQVNQFIIKHASEGGETASYNTKAYNIQVSNDGTNWSTVVRVTNNTKGVTVDDIAAVSARYIKLNVTTPTQTTNLAARIYEFQVFGPPNLALNKPATVDGTCNASQTAAKAVDGSVINDSKWCSVSGNHWLQIDLGSVKQVNQFVIKHASEGGETASYNTRAYTIQVSADGTKWSSVVNATNNTSGITVDKITGVPARYIKLTVTKPTQTTNLAARIFEFEVYGPPNLALNKPVTGDSTCNATQTAAKAVDGSVINDSKWCSLSGNRWLQIDLGSVKQVNQFVIKHASEGGETASYNAKAYNIQVSADGTNWSTAVNATNNTSGITVDNITAVSARYIKLNVTTPTQSTNPAARIYEFEVYGPSVTT